MTFHTMKQRDMKHQVRGFTLIELMVAILIGILLSIGLVQVMLAGKTAYQATQGANFMQENARFATSQLDYSIQMADHWGPVNPDKGKITTAASVALTALYAQCKATYVTDTTDSFWWSLGTYGIDGAVTNPATVLGASCLPDLVKYADGTWSDVLVLRYADSNFAECSTATCLKAPTVTASAPNKALFVRAGVAHQMVLATGAEVNAISTGTNLVDAGFTASPDHKNQDGLYTFPYRMEIYYLRKCSNPDTTGVATVACSATSDNGHPIPTLWRQRLDSSSGNLVLEPVTEGIERFRLEYGLATCPECVKGTIPVVFSDVITYKPASQISSANNEWFSVVSVRVAIMAQGDSIGNYGRGDIGQKGLQGNWYLNSDPTISTAPSDTSGGVSAADIPMLQHTIYTTLGQTRNRVRG